MIPTIVDQFLITLQLLTTPTPPAMLLQKHRERQHQLHLSHCPPYPAPLPAPFSALGNIHAPLTVNWAEMCSALWHNATWLGPYASVRFYIPSWRNIMRAVIWCRCVLRNAWNAGNSRTGWQCFGITEIRNHEDMTGIRRRTQRVTEEERQKAQWFMPELIAEDVSLLN